MHLCRGFTAVAALSATAYAVPQGFGGNGGNGAPSSGTSTASLATGASTATSSASSSTSTLSSGAACNNSPDLCDRSYNKVTHIGAHDSSFLRDESTSFSIAGNQYFSAVHALDMGLRLLQVQVHDKDGTIEMCHTICELLDAGSLQSWLSDIRTWMDNNSNEVVTLILVNSDNKAATDFGTVFKSSGIEKYAYTPSSSSSTTWPTLGEMISSNTRLVTFVASLNTSTTYPYLLDEFTYVFETAYQVTSPSGFNCTLNRPSTQSSASAAISAGMLPLMNHFQYTTIGSSIYIPNIDLISTTNSPSTDVTGALGLHAQTCKSEWNTNPTFVLVDFWDQGPSITTGDHMNNIKATGRKSLSASAGTNEATRRLGMGTGALVAFLGAAVLMV